MSIKPTNPYEYHIIEENAIVPKLSFSPEIDFNQQKTRIKRKFLELINIPDKKTNPTPIIEYTDETDPRFNEIRFVFESEPGFFVPAHMLLPKKFNDKIPIVICLQGHSPGMHISLARERYPSRCPIEVEGDRDFCIQAVARGYATVAMEQRGFGELGFKDGGCHDLSWQAAMMGKTLIGERIRDIIALIDAITSGFDYIDIERIGIMGNSGGGTSSYFASCVDERIKCTMPSSTFCTFVAAWGSIYHCDCSYVPGILKYMEMPDMAVMIAPRPLIIVNGVYDHLQPFEAAKEAFKKVQQIYTCAGVADNCKFVVGTKGHQFYGKEAWPVFDKYI